jgi:hypothetical protein
VTKPISLTAPQLEGVVWRKSSYSGSSEGQCVEVADATRTHAAVAVRDSKRPHGPALLFAPEAFASFIADVNDGGFSLC